MNWIVAIILVLGPIGIIAAFVMATMIDRRDNSIWDKNLKIQDLEFDNGAEIWTSPIGESVLYNTSTRKLLFMAEERKHEAIINRTAKELKALGFKRIGKL